MIDRRIVAFTIGIACAQAASSPAQQIYWSDNYSRTIRRVSADGTSTEVLIAPPLEWPVGLALHTGLGRMFWTDYETRKIQSARLDGTDVRDVRTPDDGMLTPRGIAVDPESGKLYWSEKDFDTFISYIRRADLNGDNVETLLTRTGEPYALALDLAHDRIYWTEAGNWGVWRANLDGTDPQRLISTNIGVPYGIALDVARGKVYWVNGGSQQRIERANLDGTDRETIFPGACNPLGIALDLSAGRVFWSDPCLSSIWSAALDGSGAATFVEFREVWALAVDPAAGKLYSAATDPVPIRRIALDGSNPEELIVSLAADVRGLVLSHAEGFLYWWREGTRIYRSRFDGSDAELFRNLNGFGYAVRGLGLDTIAGRLYWVLYNPDSEIYELQSVGLNGQGFQAVAVDEFDGIQDVAYSHQRSKFYFVNISPCSISAFRQSGGVAEVVHSDAKACPAGLTLDAPRGHLYWGDPDLGAIRRSNLDGQSVESIPILDVGLPVSLGVATFVGDLFWIDTLTSSIRRGPISGGPSIAILPLDFNTNPGGFVVDSRSPGDADADGLVNLADFRIFQNCFTGPTPRRLRAECVFFDSPPADGDIDDADWEFLYSFYPDGHAFRPGRNDVP